MISRTGLAQMVLHIGVTGLVAFAADSRAQANPSVAPDQLQARFMLDKIECQALANQMISEPPPPPQPPSGTFTLDTPRGPVYGTYQGQPPPQQGWRPSGFLGGMERSQRENDRQQYAVACMVNRGWQPR